MKKPIAAAKRPLPKKAAPPAAKVVIRKIPSGVRGLDDILGGGVPEFSFMTMPLAPLVIGRAKASNRATSVSTSVTIAK